MVHTAADFMWVVPGECEGWCVTCTGHADLGAHTLSHSKLCRGCSSLCFAAPLFDKALEPLKEENSKAACFGKVKVWPYLLRLLTAMHTPRINASTTRATTMISQSVGRNERGEESMWMSLVWFCHFTELQEHNLYYFLTAVTHFSYLPQMFVWFTKSFCANQTHFHHSPIHRPA